MIVLALSAWFAAVTPPTVLVVPPKGGALSDADRIDLERRIMGDLKGRPGIKAIAPTVDDEEDWERCRRDLACVMEVADAHGAEFIVVTTVELAGERRVLEASLLPVNAAGSNAGTSAPAVITRVLKSGDPLVAAEETRLTVASLVSKFHPGAAKLDVRPTEDDVAVRIDGTTAAVGMNDVKAGAHVVQVSADGFEPYTKAFDLDDKSVVVVDAKLIPTESTKESHAFWAWTFRIASVSTMGVGTLLALGGGGGGAAAFFLAESTNQAIRDHNADPTRDDEGRAALETQALAVNALTVGSVVAASTGVVIFVVGGVLFFVGDDPGRYDE